MIQINQILVTHTQRTDQWSLTLYWDINTAVLIHGQLRGWLLEYSIISIPGSEPADCWPLGGLEDWITDAVHVTTALAHLIFPPRYN